ncbi:MAG: hypothetical protein PWQ94_1564 [Thermoanaerobacterium sp.]|nr:hypothetical protein [Thermoanaerobacterium sp.]
MYEKFVLYCGEEINAQSIRDCICKATKMGVV